jgi:pimeloyl-ACP methyl ester carboxylesterase
VAGDERGGPGYPACDHESAAPPPVPWDVDGPPDAPAIVFLHGSVLARQSWFPQVARLRDAYRCVSVDLPAHGSLADRPFTLEAAVDGVVEAIDAAAGGRAVLVGLSLGGYVAIAVADRSPERVRGLVLAGATAEPGGIGGLLFRLFALGLRVLPPRIVGWTSAHLVRTRLAPAEARVVGQGGTWLRGGALGVSALTGRGFHAMLRRYPGPVLVINGDLDLVMVLGERWFTRGLRQVTRRRLRRTTHLSNLDRPEEFTALVRRFVASIAP